MHPQSKVPAEILENYYNLENSGLIFFTFGIIIYLVSLCLVGLIIN